MSKPFPESLKIGPHAMVFPIVHGSGDFAWEIRRAMLQYDFDCVAVPLPESFREGVEAGIVQLPVPSVVVQKSCGVTEYRPDAEEEESPSFSYVPVDPCQGVIAALRVAMEERLPRKFIDLETDRYEPFSTTLPDPYALKQLSMEKFAAAVAPFLEPSTSDQWSARIAHMAWQLRELSVDYKRILFVCNIVDWPWIRESFGDRQLKKPEDENTLDPARHDVDPDTYYFLMREIPFIANLYENARRELDDDENLSVDGVKELLLHSRDLYFEEYQNRARKLTPSLMSRMLKYIRNLTLIGHRLSPQLSDIVTAAQQVAGDGYARIVLETAKEYEFRAPISSREPCRMGIDRIAMPDDEVGSAVNRLPGPPIFWKSIEIQPKPDERLVKDWQQSWNPHAQCSWPAEDEMIESFRRTVFDRASEVLGADMAKTEKFTTSVKDGIDIRDTIRNWHTGDIYVKVLPPSQGKMDAAVMLFDSPADPREYSWRTTWFAEHDEESTLAFYATDFHSQPVGPGICLAHYGGAMFLYPPIIIQDIWSDPRLDFASTLEERLIAAACMYATCPHVALLSSAPPGLTWKRIAKRYGKKLVHLPLSKFSDSTVQQLRMVHVLNGQEVRSYASNFIRRV